MTLRLVSTPHPTADVCVVMKGASVVVVSTICCLGVSRTWVDARDIYAVCLSACACCSGSHGMAGDVYYQGSGTAIGDAGSNASPQAGGGAGAVTATFSVDDVSTASQVSATRTCAGVVSVQLAMDTLVQRVLQQGVRNVSV